MQDLCLRFLVLSFCTTISVTWCQTAPPTHLADSSAEAGKIPSTDTAAVPVKEQIRELRRQAAALREQARFLRNDTLQNDKLDPLPSATAAAVPAKDTVELLSKESTNGFLLSFKGKKRRTRQRGFGGGIGPTLGIYALHTGPINNLLRILDRDADFGNAPITIDKPFARFLLSGISGYGAVGNGLRIGGCFMSGSRSYSSPARHNDTTYIYNVEITPNFGGLLLEKAIVIDNVNLFFGGLIGGASLKVRPSKSANPYTSVALDSDEYRTDYNELNARSLLLELHGGFTYSMINWFHIGADLSAPMFFSQSGFVTSGGHSLTNGFLTVNPGLRIRIIIGNIG